MAPFLSQSTCSYTLQDLFSPNVFPCFHYLHTCLRDIIFQCLFSLVSSFLDILGMFFSNFFQRFFQRFFPCVTSNFIHVFSSLIFMCFIKCRTIFPCVFPWFIQILYVFSYFFQPFSDSFPTFMTFQAFSSHFPMVFPKFLVPFFPAPPFLKACGVEDGASAAPALPPAVAMEEARAEAWRAERWKRYGKYGGFIGKIWEI